MCMRSNISLFPQTSSRPHPAATFLFFDSQAGMSPLLFPPSTSLLGPTWVVRLMKKKTDMSSEKTTVAHMKVPNCLKKVSCVGSRNMDAPKLWKEEEGAG